MIDGRPLSLKEQIKLDSDGLRGSIAQELASPLREFSRTNVQLLRFHGIFQQDDRDQRLQRRSAGHDLDFEFTLRVRATGGRLTAYQLLGMLELADEFRLGSLRATSRQGLQLSHLRKRDLRPVLARIAQLGLTTFSSGGDVNCNVVCCPAEGVGGAARSTLRALAEQINAMLMPDDAAYRSIWLSGNSLAKPPREQSVSVSHEIYGPAFLPHKLKIGLALPEDNCVDVLAQDIGLLMSCRGEQVVGYEVFVGGGMSMSPSVSRNSPRLAQPLAFVAPDQVLAVIRAIVEVYRESGDRTRPNQARMKYLVADCGIEEFGRLVQHRLGSKLAAPRGIAISGRDDHLGWHGQEDGLWQLGIAIESGRLVDESHSRLVSALRSILRRFELDVSLTAQQNLLLRGIRPASRDNIAAALEVYGIAPVAALSGVRRSAMSCPALPSCGSAITEAERIVPELLASMEMELTTLGLADEPCSVCVTGCSHGCARCYLADIALVGRTIDVKRKVDKFAIYIGGDALGRRLNRLYQDLVPIDQVIDVLRPLLIRFQQERDCQETLGAFLWRVSERIDASEVESSLGQ